jgi:hypothetical protein
MQLVAVTLCIKIHLFDTQAKKRINDRVMDKLSNCRTSQVIAMLFQQIYNSNRLCDEGLR